MKSVICAAFAAVMLAFGAVGADEAPQYYTNAVELARLSAERGVMCFALQKVDPKDYAAVDDILSASPSNIWVGVGIIRDADKNIVKPIEKTAKKCYDWWKTVSPAHATTDYNYYRGDNSYCFKPWYIANNIDTLACKYTPANDTWIGSYKKECLNAAMRTTKEQLRKEGKSFVQKGDYNPVQERLDALTKALDAPMMAGAKEAFAKCGIEFVSDPAQWLPQGEELAALKDDVFYGRKDFTPSVKGTLLVALGVDAYNKFVKDYNGEE